MIKLQYIKPQKPQKDIYGPMKGYRKCFLLLYIGIHIRSQISFSVGLD